MAKMKYSNILEEEIKNKVTQDFFSKFDCTKILGKIDFAVKSPSPTLPFGERADSPPSGELEGAYLLWAEAKQKPTDIIEMLTQLVLTIGKVRTFDEILPPPFLGCYDNEKIAFVPYADIQDIFYLNDFNWNVTPSNRETREFKQVYAQIQKIISPSPTLPQREGVNSPPSEGLGEAYLFNFATDEKELQRFIRENFIVGKSETTKIKIDKNNFIIIYNKWLDTVKPTIQVDDWGMAKKNGIIDGDFYLADLLSAENKTLKEKLFVLLKTDHYELDRRLDESGFKNFKTTSFSDNQKAHTQFWAKYERPPLEEYWDYIIERRDLLVPQDVRERKGSFFTPKIWVELSQKYLADVLGKDWQDEYYIWDCAAGTGNLLVGLAEKYHIWASTLDKADVEVMRQRIKNGANLLENHVFQFDFLNDDFSKLPESLQAIINDSERRKKLIIYINPPYMEHGNRSTFAGDGEHKAKVSTEHKVYKDFQHIVGTGTREGYAQFFLRIYKEIPNTILASFSTLKFVNAQNFVKFRNYFKAEFLKGFICHSNTFDNVPGHFPIGFLIWNLSKKEDISQVETDIFFNDKRLKKCWQDGRKTFYAINEKVFISDWLRKFYDKQNEKIGYLILPGVDMQQQNGVYITSQPTKSDILQHKTAGITKNNLIEMSIYLAVRKCIDANWINNRDQFLYPNDGWKTNLEFQNDCLTYTLFSNNIQSKFGVNHWIPFSEYDVNAQEKFDSNFMTDFFAGKTDNKVAEPAIFYGDEQYDGGGNYVPQQREFSETAKNVFKAGKKIWKYYHEQPNANPNASLYDIREYFQGRNDKGKMNNKSDNEKYSELIGNLRMELKILARKIEPKIYEYGFLKK